MTYIEKLATFARKDACGDIVNNNSDMFEDIKHNLHIQIKYVKNSKYTAFTKWDDDTLNPVIVLRADDTFEEQAIALAHELGALFLGWQWIPNHDLQSQVKQQLSKQYNIMSVIVGDFPFRVDNQNVKINHLINQFALAFLMPYKNVMDVYNKAYTKDLNGIWMTMIDVFRLPSSLTKARLLSLKCANLLTQDAYIGE